jgi:hypothetical protein
MALPPLGEGVSSRANLTALRLGFHHGLTSIRIASKIACETSLIQVRFVTSRV